MSILQICLLVFVLTIVLNVVPLFMPPTWMLLSWFYFNYSIPVLLLALVGAAAATIGRGLLALLFRRIGLRLLPERWQRNIGELSRQAEQRLVVGLAAYVAFLLGPLPSEQLFIAMGIARTPLTIPLAVFAVIRFLGYLIWITTASVVAMSLDDLLRPGTGGTVGIVVQILSMLLLFGLMQIDWQRLFRARKSAS
jgi:hypothetical protein